MKTTAALALAALLSGAAIASPVLAADSAGFDSDYFVAQLRYDGVNAIDAEDYWNGTFRAIVELDDGSRVFQYFDKASFAPVNLAG
jgi:hypothetical protein